MKEQKTIEQQAGEAILQSASETITIAGTEYVFGKPSVATIIMCSELISLLPEVDGKDPSWVNNSLRIAKDSRVLGEIAAVIILGAKRVMEHRKVQTLTQTRKKSLLAAFRKSSDKFIEEEEKDALARNILLELSPSELSELITGRLARLQLGSFFGITTSLAEANVLKRTKSGVEDETIQSGQ